MHHRCLLRPRMDPRGPGFEWSFPPSTPIICLVLESRFFSLRISGGQKGDICIFDLRQNQLRHSFQAHDSAVKCLALDPTQEAFATGAADGDIRVWGFTVHNLIHHFPAQHVQTSSFFRQGSAGISQLSLLPSGSSLYRSGSPAAFLGRSRTAVCPAVLHAASVPPSPAHVLRLPPSSPSSSPFFLLPLFLFLPRPPSSSSPPPSLSTVISFLPAPMEPSNFVISTIESDIQSLLLPLWRIQSLLLPP